MNILISGLYGHMGQQVLALCQNGYLGSRLAFGVDYRIPEGATLPCTDSFSSEYADANAGNCDVIVDFSHHSVTPDLLNYAVSHNLPLVLATTGHTPEERDMITAASAKIPLFFASNFSMGIALLAKAAKEIALGMPDAEIEIVETHHDRKLDAPSGTALSLAGILAETRPGATVQSGRTGYGKRQPNDIGIQSVRIGNVVGIHEILIGTPSQTITLKHEAHSRALFAEGALTAAAFLIGKGPGLYDMNSLVSKDI